MLGTTAADDAVQEAWCALAHRLHQVENLRAWLTTVVGRVALDMLRARGGRGGPRHLEPIVSESTEENPAEEAELADSVGLAMLVVLENLSPAERVAFVLHDMFGVPFAEIGEITGREPDAARQLASRARRRVRGSTPPTDADVAEQRRVIDAFLAAARAGDFEALMNVLDPDIVLRVHTGEGDPRAEVLAATGPEKVVERIVTQAGNSFPSCARQWSTARRGRLPSATARFSVQRRTPSGTAGS
jgi:RNA polymerase sigma-70 factor (ECF subfamily)